MEPRHVYHCQLHTEDSAAESAPDAAAAAPAAPAPAPPIPCPEIQPAAAPAPGRFGAARSSGAAVAAAALKALRRQPSGGTTSSDATASPHEVTLHLPPPVLTDTPVAMAISKPPSGHDPRLSDGAAAPLSLPDGRADSAPNSTGPRSAPTDGKRAARLSADATCVREPSSPGTPQRSASSGGSRAAHEGAAAQRAADGDYEHCHGVTAWQYNEIAAAALQP